jgi:hypothetical protein
MNGTFSRPPRHPGDAHARAGSAMLDGILCREYGRKVSNDYIIRSEARLFQILPATQPKPRPGDAVLVRVRLDASVRIFWKNKPLHTKKIKTMFED